MDFNINSSLYCYIRSIYPLIDNGIRGRIAFNASIWYTPVYYPFIYFIFPVARNNYFLFFVGILYVCVLCRYFQSFSVTSRQNAITKNSYYTQLCIRILYSYIFILSNSLRNFFFFLRNERILSTARIGYRFIICEYT